MQNGVSVELFHQARQLLTTEVVMLSASSGYATFFNADSRLEPYRFLLPDFSANPTYQNYVEQTIRTIVVHFYSDSNSRWNLLILLLLQLQDNFDEDHQIYDEFTSLIGNLEIYFNASEHTNEPSIQIGREDMGMTVRPDIVEGPLGQSLYIKLWPSRSKWRYTISNISARQISEGRISFHTMGGVRVRPPSTQFYIVEPNVIAVEDEIVLTVSPRTRPGPKILKVEAAILIGDEPESIHDSVEFTIEKFL